MSPWYKNGLRFQCTGCGQCCTGFPGYVWVTETEIQEIAKTLNIPVEECIKKYVCRIGDRYSLRERPKTYACVFLEGKKCSIYHARPKQCRTFPWWPENLSTRRDWHELAERCEGIGHPDAPLVAFGEIQEQLQIQIGTADASDSSH